MRSRELLPLLLFLTGIGVWMIAWSKHAYWWVLFAGLLLAAGARLAWKRRRRDGATVDPGQDSGWYPDSAADGCGDGGSGGGGD